MRISRLLSLSFSVIDFLKKISRLLAASCEESTIEAIKGDDRSIELCMCVCIRACVCVCDKLTSDLRNITVTFI